ncbi:MAGE family-domain-containing protein [Massariosphaeria phaeospora]|uniref:MAGE family-domain-containing protein n=1 Tax=Massariosphaeria phaeospora TaxID=100035 RepID=A0A7C8I5Z5_9PLEO|nr:MAGE family-domain-containing protein [Massariosphaeria phaeospora]
MDDDDDDEHDNGSGSLAQLTKGFVRYALACEYSRIPIKRQEVNQKVLGAHARAFRHVFDAANSQLMEIFGMRMVELPNREKVTIRQKRAAAGSESQNKSSNMWVLQTVLPPQYRTPDILGPDRKPSSHADPDVNSAYVGLYTLVISLIYLTGGTLSEPKLDRYLKRLNADQTTPVDSKDKLLARMVKEGYIVKIKDDMSGEELIDYMVGPRGKVEVGEEGAANLVRAVSTDDGTDDLNQRLERTLGIGGEAQAVNGDAAPVQAARRPGRPRRRDDDDDDE